MMFDIFGEKVYETVVEWGIKHYKKEYERELPPDCNDEFWKSCDEFYKKMNEDEKEIFFNILEMTMIDTVSHILGILDGSSSLAGGVCFEPEIKINGEDMVCELQDSFLAYVEEQESNNSKMDIGN